MIKTTIDMEVCHARTGVAPPSILARREYDDGPYAPWRGRPLTLVMLMPQL